MECQAAVDYQPLTLEVLSAEESRLNSNLSSVSGGLEQRLSEGRQGCRVLDMQMQVSVETGPNTSSNNSKQEEMERLPSEAAEPGGDGGQLPFSKELITFSLFGKMPAKLKRPWNESLSARIAEVQQAFKNIPQMLYFSPSSVALDGIGVYAAESLPKDTLLGPYLGKAVRKDQVDINQNNEWLWEVYEDDSLSYFIDARDPKYGNWMNFIQCARNSLEQNLRMAQYSNNLYFVVTADIKIGEELLVWYDEEQYNTYMGLPTGFREIPPPPLFMEQHAAAPQDSAAFPPAGHASPGGPSLPDPPPPPYPSSYCSQSNTSIGGSNFSDSASTDDSGISHSIETNEGPTPPLTHTSYELTTAPRHTATTLAHKETLEPGYNETATSAQFIPSMVPNAVTLSSASSPSESGFHYVGIDANIPSDLHWSIPPHNSSPSSGEMMKMVTATTPDQSPAHTPSEGSASWLPGGPTRPFVESPTGMSMLQGGIGGKKQLLYGLFSRSEDGSRWLCEECKRLFSSQGSLRAHARIHTGERPYQCQYCFRAFCQASTLRSHERLHTGEKPYKCEDCGRAFTQSAGLRSHRKTHRYDS